MMRKKDTQEVIEREEEEEEAESRRETKIYLFMERFWIASLWCAKMREEIDKVVAATVVSGGRFKRVREEWEGKQS